MLLVLARVLLGADFSAFFRWYTAILLIGIGCYPLTSILFRSYGDCGWLFSKTIGLALAGYVVWVLASFRVLQFTSRRSLVVTLILAGVCWMVFMLRQGRRAPDYTMILREEFVFLAVFLMWTWFAGFRPAADGTEKFMDYGFMAAMMRNHVLPAKDIWYGLEPINYYYGGQYYGVYLAKISYVSVKQAYNLYRMMIASFAFCLPMSLVGHMLRDRLREVPHSRGYAAIGGALAGAAVSLAGNVHYVLYGLFGKILQLPGYETYWFPSSTRYIGYNPDCADKCIHEYPSYSFILGDVHAHMVNVMFVLTVLGILYAWGRNARANLLLQQEAERLRVERERRRPTKYNPLDKVLRNLDFIKGNLLEPGFLLVSFYVGIFHWTNYWDYIIYFTVAFITCVFVSFHRYQKQMKRVVVSALLHMVEMVLIGTLVALPFTLRFQTMVSGIGIATAHTLPHQMLILWGLPVAVFVLLAVCILVSYHRDYRTRLHTQDWEEGEAPGRFYGFFRYVKQPDRFAIILGICAVGLILIPELVYVRDIYENGYARSNTMFKLTYQAYIMFGLLMSYGFVRLLTLGKHLIVRVLTGLLLVIFLLTLGYFPYSVKEWFGHVWNPKEYQGLDATAFVEQTYPEDAGAIRWLDRELKGQPLVLEAPGDSYSAYCRVSAMTGLPTLEGWYVHEWLWRSNPEDLTQKMADIEAIYTASNVENVEQLLRNYRVSYIFVGSCEREKYPNLNDSLLRNLGEVVYEAGDTYIVKTPEADALALEEQE